MPWVLIDDGFPEHPKIVAVTPLGQALQVAALCYCNRRLTDGLVPKSVARTLLDFSGICLTSPQNEREGRKPTRVTSEDVIDWLVTTGIWKETKLGYQIHNYSRYQRSKQEILDLTEKRSLAGKKGADAKWKHGKNGKPDGKSYGKAMAKRCPNPNTPSKTFEFDKSNSGGSEASVLEVFEYAKQVLGRNWRFTEDRKRRIRARLREGYTVDDLKRAADGVLKDTWEKRRTNGNDDIVRFLGSGSQVEKFSLLAQNGTGSGAAEQTQQARELLLRLGQQP